MPGSYQSGIQSQTGALQSNPLPWLLYPPPTPHSQSKLPSTAKKHSHYSHTGIHHQGKRP